jgi:hypothetical protein
VTTLPNSYLGYKNIDKRKIEKKDNANHDAKLIYDTISPDTSKPV